MENIWRLIITFDYFSYDGFYYNWCDNREAEDLKKDTALFLRDFYACHDWNL